MSLSPPIPQHLLDQMADIGPRWRENISGHIRTMLDAFSEVQASAPKDGVEVRQALRYGDHARHEYDLYLPADGGTRRPLVLFVHGGAFTEGHRNRTPEIYANVLYYLARHGIAGANMNYRLAPEAGYPEATRDIATLLGMLREQAGSIGVDPARLFLFGHSAGGAHVGSYAYDARHHPAEGPGLAGLIIVSGRMRAEMLPANPNAKRVQTYYGTDDPDMLDDYSPVSHISKTSVPTFVAWGEFENPLIDVHCAELTYRLGAAKGYCPPTMWLRGHNHTSTIAHINTADDELGTAIRAFIAKPK